MSERFLGINIEYKNTNRKALFMLVAASWFYHKITGFEVEGQLPKIGSALVVTNHTSSMDILKMCYACVTTSQRIIRGVARKSLLNPSLNEPEEVLERTGKKGHFDPMKLPLVAPTIAFVLNGIGAIPIERGERNITNTQFIREFLPYCDSIINSGQLLGIFPQETRVREGDLRDVMPGIGFLARRYAEVPIVPIGISERIVRIGQSFTCADLEKALGKGLGIRETTAEIVGRIAYLLPEPIRERWERLDRPLFLAKN